MKHVKKVLLLFLIVLSITVETNAGALAPVQRPDVMKEAEVVSVTGDGWVRFRTEKDWITAVSRQILSSGDWLRTGTYGKMSILFVDDIQIKIHNRTTLVIKEVGKPPQKKGSVFKLEAGEIWSRAKTVPEGLRIETPSATAAIRGTDWDIIVDDAGTSYIAVLRGTVDVFNDYGRLSVLAGEQAVTEIGKPPVKTFLIRPRDRVQWVVSYPFNLPDLMYFSSHRIEKVRDMVPMVKDAQDIKSKTLLAGLLFDLREKEESRRLFDEVLVSDKNNCRALTFRGFLALDDRYAENAASYFDNALKSCRDSEKTDALIGKAGVHLGKNELEKAAEIFNNLKLRVPSPVVGVVISSFQAFLGNLTNAIEISTEYASRYPDDERFLTLLAGFYLLKDESVKAKEVIGKALALHPGSSHALTVLGTYYHLNGMGREAEEAYRKAIESDPKNSLARNGLALVLMEKAYYRESRDEFSQAIDVNPHNAMLLSNRGILASITGDLKGAHDDIGKAIEVDPSNYAALNGQGFIALKEGRTQESIQHFLRSSLMEPNFAQTHVLLAIAYYQTGDITHALEEVSIAESLDPKDPYPHLIAYVIYQDTYRPFEAVKEAHNVLELLPYLKSLDPLANTRSGLLNLGSALMGLGMSDWADSYAQESYDPHNASSHFFSSRRYNENHIVSVSELIQGLLLDPLAQSQPTRYNDIIRKPRHDMTMTATIGDEDGGFLQQYSLTAQGYFKQGWDISYALVLQAHDRDGFVENGYSEGYALVYGMGIKPDFDNGINIGISLINDKSGDPGSVSESDPDDELEFSSANIDIGYRHRFGPKNNLLARFVYDKTEFELKNPSAFGSNLTDFQLSFIYAGFDPSVTRRFFETGVYDLTKILGGSAISLATDSTGELSTTPGVYRLPSYFPLTVDFDPRRNDSTEQRTFLLQARHLFDINDKHHITYGFEYIPFRVKMKTVYNQINTGGTIEFFEELFLPDGILWTFPLATASVASQRSTNDGRLLLVYAGDRWSLTQNLLVEGGLFFESHHDDNSRYDGLHPRIGIAATILKDHILRFGFQKWLDQSSSGTLSPVSVAGLVVDNSLAVQGSRLTDYQVRVESRWTDRIFSAIGFEMTDLKDPDMGEDFSERELSTGSFMASLNAILTAQTGIFFRYRYTDSKVTKGIFEDKSPPGIPGHLLSGGIVWVSPKYVKAMMATSYVGRQFEDYLNTIRVSDYWVTSLSISAELFRKRILIAGAIDNLFDANFPASGRSTYLTLEYRF